MPPRVRFDDHRAAHCQRGCGVATGHGESEREVRRREHGYGADRTQDAAQVGLGRGGGRVSVVNDRLKVRASVITLAKSLNWPLVRATSPVSRTVPRLVSESAIATSSVTWESRRRRRRSAKRRVRRRKLLRSPLQLGGCGRDGCQVKSCCTQCGFLYCQGRSCQGGRAAVPAGR